MPQEFGSGDWNVLTPGSQVTYVCLCYVRIERKQKIQVFHDVTESLFGYIKKRLSFRNILYINIYVYTYRQKVKK